MESQNKVTEKRGRKPIADKKREISLFVEQSKIDKLGKEQIQAICYDMITTTILKLENKSNA